MQITLGHALLAAEKFSPAGWLGTVDYAFLFKRYVTFLLFPPSAVDPT
jgi:hypothetical protein